MAARYDCSDSAPSSLPPPFPKSPPDCPDLFGKRREMAKIQVLEREIGYLEAELKSVNGLQPTSRSCKEIVDFVAANSDPLIPTFKKNLRRYHGFRKWLRGLPGFGLSRVYCCCYSGCCHCCNWTPSCPAECLLWQRPTAPRALPKCLQCRHTPLNALFCGLPNSLRCHPNLCCCKNTSFGRRCCSFSNDTSCCLPCSSRRRCSKCSSCSGFCYLRS